MLNVLAGAKPPPEQDGNYTFDEFLINSARSAFSFFKDGMWIYIICPAS